MNIVSFIRKHANLAPIPEYADVMSIEEFINCVECGGFIDDDGFGCLVFEDKEVINSTTWLDHCPDPLIVIDRKTHISLRAIRDSFGSEAKIAWYNK